MRPTLGPGAACMVAAGALVCLSLPQLPGRVWLLCILLAGIGHWWRKGRGHALGMVCVGFALAGLHAAQALDAQLPPRPTHVDAVIVGRVVGLPVHEARRTRFRLRVDADGAGPLRGKQIQLSWYDPYGSTHRGPRVGVHAGERWRVPVRLRAPWGLRNPGGFDGERHALAQRIAALGYVRDPGSAIRLDAARGMDAMRERLSARIAHVDGAAGMSRFIRALAVGDTGALEDGDWDVLRANGLTHLIAISGFHVGLAAGFFALLAKAAWWCVPALSRRWPSPVAAGVAGLCGACAYAGLAGFALPTLRTILMIGIVVLMRVLRRSHGVAQSLSLAAIAIVLVDPLALLAAGFWLTFVRVASLAWCLSDHGGAAWRDFQGAQGVSTIGLLPLTAVLFGQASLAGPLANLVAVPLWSLVVVPLALLGLVVEICLGHGGDAFWRAAGWVFGTAWPWFQALAGTRHALWWLPESGVLALCAALLGAFWLLLPRGVPGKSLALLLWLPLLWPQRGLPGEGAMEIIAIDVGQGLSVLVRTAGHALLYDTGPASPDGFDAGEQAVVPALRALGVHRLDAIVVSHGDSDHAGGLAAVRADFPARSLSSSPDGPVAGATPCLAGHAWEWDGVRFRFLHPPRHFPYLGNESSCVLRIESRHGTALLTGDIGAVIERRLVHEAAGDVRADVVTVAHHGSRGSSDPAFVAAAHARIALVSSGHGNRFGHPADTVVARWRGAGAQVVSTPESGAVRVEFTPDGIHARMRRHDWPRAWDAARRWRMAGQARSAR